MFLCSMADKRDFLYLRVSYSDKGKLLKQNFDKRPLWGEVRPMLRRYFLLFFFFRFFLSSDLSKSMLKSSLTFYFRANLAFIFLKREAFLVVLLIALFACNLGLFQQIFAAITLINMIVIIFTWGTSKMFTKFYVFFAEAFGMKIILTNSTLDEILQVVPFVANLAYFYLLCDFPAVKK